MRRQLLSLPVLLLAPARTGVGWAFVQLAAFSSWRSAAAAAVAACGRTAHRAGCAQPSSAFNSQRSRSAYHGAARGIADAARWSCTPASALRLAALQEVTCCVKAGPAAEQHEAVALRKARLLHGHAVVYEAHGNAAELHDQVRQRAALHLLRQAAPAAGPRGDHLCSTMTGVRCCGEEGIADNECAYPRRRAALPFYRKLLPAACYAAARRSWASGRGPRAWPRSSRRAGAAAPTRSACP